LDKVEAVASAFQMHNLINLHSLTAFAGLESFWTNFDSVFGTEYNLAVAQLLPAIPNSKFDSSESLTQRGLYNS
jgi:hypothetical protein